MESSVKKPSWYALDNSAKIYPAVRSRNWASTFRVSVTLCEEIDPQILQRALEDTVRRIPTFCLSLRRGVFWYYLDSRQQQPQVEPDVHNPCKSWKKGTTAAIASGCGITAAVSRLSCSTPLPTGRGR